MTTSLRTVALASHPFLSAIPAESLRRLGVHAHGQTFAKGHEIFREGQPAGEFILIRQGLVRLDAEVADRGRIEVEKVGADAAMGWSWLFPPYRWHLSATALERTTAIVFDADVLRGLMASDPVLGYELMRRFTAVLFDRLQATRHRLTAPTPDDAVRGSSSGPWAGRPSTGSTGATDPRGRVPGAIAAK
jgi:CRP/FNR family cyclic AMP-dependent transcriptional regulator